jgi:pilus assembly protein CpaE
MNEAVKPADIKPADIKPARKSGRRMPVHVELAGGDDEQRSALQTVLSRIDELDIQFVSGTGAAGGAASTAKAVTLMLILDQRNQDVWRREVRSRNPNGRFAAVIALVSDPSPPALRAALHAGADDVLGMPPPPVELFHSLFRVSELSRRSEGLHDKMVCSLVSVCGGVGVSHLTVNLALALHRMFQKRTAIVELDLQAAPLAVLLNAEPEHTIGELADPTSVIDSIRLESVLCKHESGLYWLAAPKRIEEAELVSAATVEATLKVLRELFDVVLVDCGSHLTESSIVTWERSDYLLYLIDQAVVAIRAAQRFLELYQRLGLKDVEPSFVLSQFVAGGAITPQRIEAALQRSIFATIPRDDRSFAEQQITGADLWQISSAAALRASVEELARKLFAVDTGNAARKSGLVGKLLAGMGFFKGAKNGTD